MDLELTVKRKAEEEERLIAWSLLTAMLDVDSMTERQREAYDVIDKFVNPPKGGDASQQIILNLFQ